MRWLCYVPVLGLILGVILELRGISVIPDFDSIHFVGATIVQGFSLFLLVLWMGIVI